MTPTTVLTANIGEFDHLRPPRELPPDVKYVCYADQPAFVEGWQIQPAYMPYEHMGRNSRIPKILSHLHCDTEYSVWHDCCFTAAVDMRVVVSRHLRNADIALFRHPGRADVYSEVAFCRQQAVAHGFDDGLLASIQTQVEAYRSEGMPGAPFCCGGVIVRRENDAVQHFNELWWREFRRWGVRDQFSLHYALWKSGVRVAVIDQYIHESPYFDFTFHAAFRNVTNDAFEPERRRRMQRQQEIEALCV